jgi:putative copper export protein
MKAIEFILAAYAVVLGIMVYGTWGYRNKYTEALGLRTRALVATALIFISIALTLSGAMGEPMRRELQDTMGLSTAAGTNA